LAKSMIAHVVGTGTIGEPLIGMLADNREAFGLDEVTFHKRTPMLAERGKVEDLVRRGAMLAVDDDRRLEFQALGHSPKYEKWEALERASVVIDCTPAGNQNKADYYESLSGPRGFLAQGSAFGFGKMYARGINDASLDRSEDRYLHIVSCNTHNISAMIQSLAIDTDGSSRLDNGEFLCIRRANDISQDRKFVASPTVDSHKDGRFGTHHARDAHDLFATLGHSLRLHSSAIKLNTQYMHTLHFSITLDHEITLEEVLDRFHSNTRVAVTYRSSANQVFSFGRDHGYYGRILSHAVVAVPSLTVRDGVQVVGFAFTPQDGNPLLSTVAAMLWYLHPDEIEQRLDVLRPFLFREV